MQIPSSDAVMILGGYICFFEAQRIACLDPGSPARAHEVQPGFGIRPGEGGYGRELSIEGRRFSLAEIS
jgi:hypothetical protein